MATRRFSAAGAIASLLIVLVIWTGRNIYSATARFRREPTRPDALVQDWTTYGATGRRLGPAHASVSIVVFNDYQCETCRRLEQRIVSLMKQYPSQLAVIVRQLPLPSHPEAKPAAQLAVCQSATPDFERLHKSLYSLVDSTHPFAVAKFAALAGVEDTIGLNSCLASPTTAATIEADAQAADRLGTFVTPSLLINEELYRGLPWDLERIVARKLERGRGN
jgi:protein-disulfide isomerase